MKTVVEVIEGTFLKCSKLQIDTQDELLDIMWALSLTKVSKISERIFDIESDEDDFISFITNMKMFGLDSKGEVRRMLKNNGLKVNNQIPPERVSDINWIKLNDTQFAIVKKGKNDFDFIFNSFILD